MDGIFINNYDIGDDYDSRIRSLGNYVSCAETVTARLRVACLAYLFSPRPEFNKTGAKWRPFY